MKRYYLQTRLSATSKFVMFLLTLLPLIPAKAYDFPLSATSIRDAYFFGRRESGLTATFLGHYTQAFPKLKVGAYSSFVTINTAFTQVAIHASKKLNYSAQSAILDFLNKQMMVELHIEVCYMLDAPPNAIQVKLTQSNKQISPDSERRSSFYPATDAYTAAPRIGEIVDLEFKPEKFQSSTMTIKIITPDGGSDDVEFDLKSLR
jgi:hypothetical protein